LKITKAPIASKRSRKFQKRQRHLLKEIFLPQNIPSCAEFIGEKYVARVTISTYQLGINRTRSHQAINTADDVTINTISRYHMLNVSSFSGNSVMSYSVDGNRLALISS
jgi:hypothetical protein